MAQCIWEHHGWFVRVEITPGHQPLGTLSRVEKITTKVQVKTITFGIPVRIDTTKTEYSTTSKEILNSGLYQVVDLKRL